MEEFLKRLERVAPEAAIAIGAILNIEDYSHLAWEAAFRQRYRG